MSIHIKPGSDPVFRDRLVIKTPGLKTQRHSPLRPLLIGGGLAVLAGGLYYAWPLLQEQGAPVAALSTQAPAPAAQEAEKIPAPSAEPVLAKAEADSRPSTAAPEKAPEAEQTPPEAAPSNVATAQPGTKTATEAAPQLSVSATETITPAIEIPEPETAATPNEPKALQAQGDEAPANSAEKEEAPKPTLIAEAPKPAPVAEASEAITEAPKVDPIEVLLRNAERQLVEFQLSRPEGDNAYETYQALERLDTAKAETLFEQILQRYRDYAQGQIEEGNIVSAASTYRTLRELDKDAQISPLLEKDVLLAWQKQARDARKNGHLDDGQGSAFNIIRAMRKLSPEHELTQATQQEALKALENTAARQVKRKRYTTPKEDNAYLTYQRILRLEPDHAGALAGLDKIAEIYAKMTRNYLKQGRFDAAAGSVKRGLQIASRHPQLLLLRKEITAQRQAARQQAAAARQEAAPAPASVASGTREQRRALRKARQQLRANKLTQPPGDNAYETYKSILVEDPENAEALAGMEKVAGQYEALARRQWQRGEFQKSLAFIGNGLAVFPNHQGLNQLKQEILEQWQ